MNRKFNLRIQTTSIGTCPPQPDFVTHDITSDKTSVFKQNLDLPLCSLRMLPRMLMFKPPLILFVTLPLDKYYISNKSIPLLYIALLLLLYFVFIPVILFLLFLLLYPYIIQFSSGCLAGSSPALSVKVHDRCRCDFSTRSNWRFIPFFFSFVSLCLTLPYLLTHFC